MTSSLEQSIEILPFEVPIDGDISSQVAVDFYSRLGVDNTFRAYFNVIDALNMWLFSGAASRFYSRLPKYKEIKAITDKLSNCQSIPAAVPDPSRKNPVPNFAQRPLTTLILEPHKRGSETYADQDAFEVIKALLVLIVLSGDREKGEANDSRIRKLSQSLYRRYRKGDRIDELSTLEEHLPNISGYYGLLAFIRKNAGMDLFGWLSELLPYLEMGELKVIENNSYRVSENSGIAKIGVLSERKTSIFRVSQSDIDEDGDNDGLFAITDSSEIIPDVNELSPPKQELSGAESPAVTELFEDIRKVSKELSYLISLSKLRVLDRDFLMFDTAVFNPIERKWLVESLDDEIPIRALMTVLCISLGENASKIGKKIIGASGDITISGYFKREIPILKNAKKPPEVNCDLYENHIGDSNSKVIYLPLPDVAKELLHKVTEIKEDITVNELCEIYGYKPTELIKSHMKLLREKYGGRFNSNRVHGQLKNYLNGSRRDACLTYALFGCETCQAPTSYYYRAFLTKELIGVYREITKEYFIINEK